MVTIKFYLLFCYFSHIFIKYSFYFSLKDTTEKKNDKMTCSKYLLTRTNLLLKKLFTLKLLDTQILLVEEFLAEKKHHCKTNRFLKI